MRRNTTARRAASASNGKSAQENGQELPKEKVVVLDTSVLIHDPECIETLKGEGFDRILIPWIVTEELDGLKAKPNISVDAREVSKKIEQYQCKGELITICKRPSKKYYKGTSLEEDNPDHQIIATVLAYKALTDGKSKEVVLMSRDTNLRIWAREVDIKAEDYPYSQVNATFQPELKSINLPRDISFHNEDKDTYFKYDASSQFEKINPNEGLIVWSFGLSGNESWGEHFLAIYKGGNHFRVIPANQEIMGLRPFTLENGSNNNGNGCKKNWSQYAAFGQILDPKIELVFLQGGAGTGKTLIAIAGALEQRSRYLHIVVARPTVHLEDHDSLGFLPGTMEAKMAPWTEPIFQAFSFLGGLKNGNLELIEKLQETRKIIIKPLDYIRGETFHRSLMIIDEAQNLTPHQVKTIITRAGIGTKMVFTGDLGQIDRTRRLDRKTSGLAYAMSRMEGEPMVGITNFNQVVRSDLAALAEQRL